MSDMRPIDPEHAILLDAPKGEAAGIIAITADEAGRYTRFSISIQGILAPEGTGTAWQISNDIAGNRNAACQALLDRPDLGWIWFIDDDHVFPPGILMQLLSRGEDIIGPVCLRRQQPFLPTAAVNGDFMALKDWREQALVQVEHTGSSGMLIRRNVIEAIDPPWFELGNGISEDVNFCRKAHEKGFPVYVDMAARLGHITTAVIWPEWDESQWVIGFEIADGARLKILTVAPDGTVA